MRTRFVLLVAGDDLAYYQQAHGACLGLLAHRRDDFDIVVHTTRPDRFRWLAPFVQLTSLDDETLSRWRGPHGDFFRAKFCVLREAAAQGSAHVVLLDADVLVRAPLDRLVAALDEGACVMHRAEKPLEARRGTHEAFRSSYGREFAGVRLHPSTLVYNSGVIGVPASRHELIARALQVNDALLAQGIRYFAIEQVAWSATLGAGPIQSAAPEIDHYWGNKRGYLALVNRVLGEALVSGWTPVEAARALAAAPIDVPARVRDRWWHRHVLRWLRIPMQ